MSKCKGLRKRKNLNVKKQKDVNGLLVKAVKKRKKKNQQNLMIDSNIKIYVKM